MKKIFTLFTVILLFASFSVFAEDSLLKQRSYVDVGATICLSGGLEVPTAGVGGSFGTLFSDDSPFMYGTGGRVDIGFGITEKDSLPFTVSAFGGAAFSYDFARVLSARVTIGPAITWESITASESKDGDALFGLGGGLEAGLSMYFGPRRNFGFFVDAYGAFCFNLSNAVGAKRMTYLLGASVGLTFSYGKLPDYEKALGMLFDAAL